MSWTSEYKLGDIVEYQSPYHQFRWCRAIVHAITRYRDEAKAVMYTVVLIDAAASLGLHTRLTATAAALRPVCKNCDKAQVQHGAAGHCLFSPTIWEQY